jgi:hypothetical protein
VVAWGEAFKVRIEEDPKAVEGAGNARFRRVLLRSLATEFHTQPLFSPSKFSLTIVLRNSVRSPTSLAIPTADGGKLTVMEVAESIRDEEQLLP